MNSIFNINKAKEPVEVETNGIQPVKKNLEEYGFTEAGRNGGDSAALSSNLAQIRDGHIVSASHDEAKQQAEQKKVEKEIENVELEIKTVEGKIKDSEGVQIPDHKKKIQEAKDDIDNLKTGNSERDSKAIFNFWTYLIIFIPLTVFVYGFYVSSPGHPTPKQVIK